MMENREIFYKSIEQERIRQDKKFPDKEKQKKVSLERWTNILLEEVGEFAREVNDHEDLKGIIELVESAAVCFRVIEIFYENRKDLLMEAYKIIEERAKHQKAKI